MKRLVVLIVVVAGLVVAGTADAAARPLAYHTDSEAASYLQHRLASWGGVDLQAEDYRSAYCLNGYYSTTEKRSGVHSPQGRLSASGEPLFHSFSCTLGAAGHDWHLYVVALPHSHWSVKADR